MNELTQILAIVVVIAHCVVIFWPRKPINEPTDENGMPIVWHNQDDTRQDVACVWNESAPAKPAPAAMLTPLPSFSEHVTAMQKPSEVPEPKRSAA